MRNGEKLPKLGGIASNNRHGTSVNNAFGHGQGSKTEFETKTPYRSDNFSGFLTIVFSPGTIFSCI